MSHPFLSEPRFDAFGAGPPAPLMSGLARWSMHVRPPMRGRVVTEPLDSSRPPPETLGVRPQHGTCMSLRDQFTLV